MMFCNVISPQFFWFKYFRTNLIWVWIIVQFPNAGMWFERFVIIATTLARDFTPSAWGMFHPSIVDICTFIGTFGLFSTLFLLFIRFLPMICMFEVKAVLPEADPHHGEAHH
jgi:molybdopterin-containing oxidoreductase family membrane subunit